MFFTALLCTDPVRPDFSAKFSNKQIQTFGTPVAGSDFGLYVLAQGDEPLSYIWLKNSTQIPNASNDTFSFDSLILSDSGDYRCIVSNESGVDTTNVYALKVFTPPLITTPNKKIQTSTSKPKIDSSYYLYIKATGSDTLKYKWYFQGALKPGSDNDTLLFQKISCDDTGIYKCIVENSYGKDSTPLCTLTITTPVNNPPQWDDDTIIDTVKESITYKIPLSDTCIDPDGDSITFRLQNGPPANDSLSSGKVYTYTPLYNDSGTYTIVLWAKDGKDSSKAVLILRVLDVNRAPDWVRDTMACTFDASSGAMLKIALTDSCKDDDHDPIKFKLLDGPPANDTILNDTMYSFTPTSNTPIEYYISFKASDAKDSSFAVLKLNIVNTVIKPEITLQPQSKSILVGDSITFTVSASGTLPLYWQWQKNKTDIPGAQKNTYTTPPAVKTDSGSVFRCIVSNSAGKDTSTEAVLTVTTTVVKPRITIHPQGQNVGKGDSALFSVTAQGTEPIFYQWQRNKADINSAFSPVYTLKNASLSDDSAKFRCIVSNTAGKDTSAEALLTVRYMNHKPVILIAGYSDGQEVKINEYQTLSYVVSVSDSDSDKVTRLGVLNPPKPGTSGTLAYDTVSGIFVYKPDYTISSLLSQNTEFKNITFLAFDNGQPALSDTFVLHFTVTNVNRAPQFRDSMPAASYKLKGGEPLMATIKADDPDGDSVFFKLNLDSTTVPRKDNIVLTGTSLVWPSETGDNGLFYIMVGVTDMKDTTWKKVSVGVGVNVPPALKVGNYAKGETVRTREGRLLEFTVTVTDPDSGQHPVILSPQNLPPQATFNMGTGIFSYTPDFSVSNKDSATTFKNVTFYATDMISQDTFIIHIQVADSNRAPVCKDTSVSVSEGGQVAVNIFATDPDGDQVFWNLPVKPGFGTTDTNKGIVGSGLEFTYTPNNLSANRVDTLLVYVHDGIVQIQPRVIITITADNDKPVITQIPAVHAVEDNISNAYSINISGFDPESTAVKWYADKLPRKGNLDKLYGDLIPGIEMLYTLKPDSCGRDTISFYLKDAQNISSDTQKIIIVIDSINDKPVINGYNNAVCDEDNNITLQITHLQVTDVDNSISDLKLLVFDSANYSIVSGTTIKPDLNFNGFMLVYVKVSDGKDTTALYPMRVTVNPVNDKPEITITNTASSLNFGGNVDIKTSFNDVDANIDSIFYFIDGVLMKKDKISAIASNDTYNWTPVFGPYVIDKHDVITIVKDSLGAKDTTDVFKIEVLGTLVSDTLSVRAILDANGDNSSINDYCHFNIENRIDTIAIWYASYTQLPSHIGNITKLINLILIKSKLSTLPTTIGNLTNLMMLNLFDNELTTLPNTVTHLNQITALDLFQNRLPINSHEPWADNWADIYCEGWRTNQKSKQ